MSCRVKSRRRASGSVPVALVLAPQPMLVYPAREHRESWQPQAPKGLVAQDVELEDVGPHQRLLPDVCEFARRKGGNTLGGHEGIGEPPHAYPEERDPHESKEATDSKHCIRDHATLKFRDRQEVTHSPQRPM